MPNNNPPPKLARKRHARGTAADSRQELVNAAISLLRRGGTAAVTTIAVTRMAGFTQSFFYQHFADVGDCLQEVARQISTRIRMFVEDHRRQSHQPSSDRESLVAHFQAMLDLFRHEHVFSELFLRHRRDSSGFGKVMRRLHRDLCSDLTRHLDTLAKNAGVAITAERLQFHAESILAQVLAGGEAVLDRRHKPTIVAEELTLSISASVLALVESARYESRRT